MPTKITRNGGSAWSTPSQQHAATTQAVTKAADTLGVSLPQDLLTILDLDLQRAYPPDVRTARAAAAEALADAAMLADPKARTRATKAALADYAAARAEQDTFDDAVTALRARKARAVRDALPAIREAFADALADDFEVLNECLPAVPDPLPAVDKVSPAAFEAYTRVRPARARVEAGLAGLAAISPVWGPSETQDRTDGARFSAWSKLLIVTPTDSTKYGPLASALYGRRAVAIQTAYGPDARTTEGDWLHLVLAAGARFGLSTEAERQAMAAAAEAERAIVTKSSGTTMVRF